MLVVKYLPFSLSFWQAATVLNSTKKLTVLSSTGYCINMTVAKYGRLVFVVNLQRISDLLNKTWAFSVALDMTTHQSTSYLDIQVRMFALKTGTVNFHVLSVSFL